MFIISDLYSPFSHPCPWRVLCLLLTYLEEEGAFWLINRFTRSLGFAVVLISNDLHFM